MQVIFIAYGIDYLAMAINAGRSLRQTNPDIASLIVTNVYGIENFLRKHFDVVVYEDEPDSANRLAKVRAVNYATEEFAAYLDVDLEVMGDFRPAFTLLNDFDVLIHALRVPTKFDFVLSEAVTGAHVAQFWGAVMFFRKNARSASLFRAWERRFTESGIRRDQPALQRAVLDCPEVRILPLSMAWGATSGEIARHSDLLESRDAIRINHYGDPELNHDILARVGDAHDAIVAALSKGQQQDPRVQESARRYRRLRHPVMRYRLLRPLALLYWSASARSSGARTSTRGKFDAAAGADHLGGQRLWSDRKSD
jgi:hypothetical protein